MRWIEKLSNFVSGSSKGSAALHLELSAQVRDLLETIRERVGARDLVDVARRSLVAYDVLSALVAEDGCRIFIRYPDGKTEELDIDMFGPPKG